MTTTPDVSVVMGVYNGGANLHDSVRSILDQQGVDFEFIVIDDGSIDGSADVLAALTSADTRIRVIAQENRGLTRALATGCAVARGAFIARQDSGDVSIPVRLAHELQLCKSNADAALVSCGARFVGPRGEPMYEVSGAPADATAGLLTLEIDALRGPAHHGCTMFRRDLYLRAGGYRDAFYFAQDLDLWTRLAELGRHLVIPEILYEARFDLGSISSEQRSRQIACARLILECARLRRAGNSELAVLDQARRIQPCAARSSSWARAAALYFIGTCLRKRTDPRADDYFRQALRACPLHVKSAARLLMG